MSLFLSVRFLAFTAAYGYGGSPSARLELFSHGIIGFIQDFRSFVCLCPEFAAVIGTLTMQKDLANSKAWPSVNDSASRSTWQEIVAR